MLRVLAKEYTKGQKEITPCDSIFLKSRSWSILLAVAGTIARAQSQGPGKFPPETRNAALRYWSAFADIQDPPADKPRKISSKK